MRRRSGQKNHSSKPILNGPFIRAILLTLSHPKPFKFPLHPKRHAGTLLWAIIADKIKAIEYSLFGSTQDQG